MNSVVQDQPSLSDSAPTVGLLVPSFLSFGVFGVFSGRASEPSSVLLSPAPNHFITTTASTTPAAVFRSNHG
ncbi:MAG: hypothetical protein Q8J74_03610 [Candidatus Didemnitutus sp.]|nr:hypothetical protein [Candidatus Didemnitutus sp.]